LLDDVRNLPGIEAAGAVSALPLSGSEGISLFLLENYANRQDQFVNSRQVTAEYFDAMGMKLVEEREAPISSTVCTSGWETTCEPSQP